MAYAIDPQTLPRYLRDNPLFHFSEENNFAPTWDRIKPHHFMPAIQHAITVAEKNIERIKAQKKPTFKNTVEALEAAYELANHFYAVYGNFIPRNEKEEADFYKDQDRIYEAWTKSYMKIFQDRTLYRQLKAVQKNPACKLLSAEKKYMMAMYNQSFIECGIEASPEKKRKLRLLESRMSRLGTKIQQNINQSHDDIALLVENPDDLKGLSAYTKNAAAQLAQSAGHDGKWAFSFADHSCGKFMQCAKSRPLRRKLWETMQKRNTRKPYDNRHLIMQLIDARQRHAHLLGHKNMAAYYHSTQMARTPQNVGLFLQAIKDVAKPIAEEEIRELKEFAQKKDGLDTFEPWDLSYYNEQLRKKTLSIAAEDLRPYFELNNVIEGIFRHVKKLMNVEFREAPAGKYPAIHESVRNYEVFDSKTGKFMGALMLDLLDRPHKSALPAYYADIVKQGLFQGRVHRPVGLISGKFQPAKKGQPVLLNHGEVVTFFHEFGHAMHALCSKCRYKSLSGTSVENDFVEFPSQLFEQWAYEPAVLNDFACHYKTGERLSDEQVESITAARKFGAGIRELGAAEYGWIDLKLAESNPARMKSLQDFESRALRGFRVMRPSVLLPSFSHIVGGPCDGYYYMYQYDMRMAHDVFDRFLKRGDIYDRSTAHAFRKALEKGGSEYGSTLFKSIMGRKPRMHAYYEREGLLRKAFHRAPEPREIPVTEATASHEQRRRFIISAAPALTPA